MYVFRTGVQTDGRAGEVWEEALACSDGEGCLEAQ